MVTLNLLYPYFTHNISVIIKIRDKMFQMRRLEIMQSCGFLNRRNEGSNEISFILLQK